MFFGKKKKTMPEISFDPKQQKAVLKCSICNGEQVAGFKDIETAAFTEVMLIKNEKELELFKTQHGITVVTKEYQQVIDNDK